MKRLLKNNRGMTLMEILVALSLLMIVIVGTTPVMLSAYDSLYTAGEYTQTMYEAKSEIEDGLATRNSIKNYEGFKVNFEGLGTVATINGKRAVSSLYTSLETLFSNARVKVAIISGSIVNDDAYDKTVVLQTTGLEYTSSQVVAKTKSNGTFTDVALSKEPGGAKVKVQAYLPDKTKEDLAVYGSEEAEVEIKNVNADSGRITVTIKGTDFTRSPVKIVVSYLDENYEEKSTSTYLTIKTPTILFAGKTSSAISYYTSAGVENVKDAQDNIVYFGDGKTPKKTLAADARLMNTASANGTSAIIDGTVFKSVNWITEYQTGSGNNMDDVGYTNACYEQEYYVLTGTNGAIYRTYTYTGYDAVKGKVNIATTDDAKQTNGTSQKDKLVVATTGDGKQTIDDQIIVLQDRSATVVYPAVWGGDFSHVFGYADHTTTVGYKLPKQQNRSGNWYTEDTSNLGTGQDGYYSNYAMFGYYYNGYGTEFNYYTQNSKKLSYILTELEYSLRLGGYLNEGAGNFDGGHNRIWERPVIYKNDGSDGYSSSRQTDKQTTGSWFDKFEAYWYGKAGENLWRTAIVNQKKAVWQFDNDWLNEIPFYLTDEGGGTEDTFGDEHFAQLRLKGLTTVSPTILGTRDDDDKDYDSISSKNNNKYVYMLATDKTVNQPKITITDAVFIPGATTTVGNQTVTIDSGMFYVGTVAAYGVINQSDNVNPDNKYHYAVEVQSNGGYQRGGATTYYVMGNDDNTSTTIYKYSSKGFGRDTENQSVFRSKSVITPSNNNPAVPANSDASREFFVPRSAGKETNKVFSDLCFTMGFASNREMVYSQVVYGKVDFGGTLTLSEAYKSYEPYYFRSHYCDESANNKVSADEAENHVPNLYMNDYASTRSYKGKYPISSSNGDTTNKTSKYLNSPDNDYYNVWFPGEMYNLTKVATKDGLVIAVGYAVSGSTYTWVKPVAAGSSENNNDKYTSSSTALGNIYNDGVISGMVLGEDTSFKSLLYYKETENFDSTSLTDKSVSTYSDIDYYKYAFETQYDDDSDFEKDDNYVFTYGTHARDSVQFTAVDIYIETLADGVTYYYAYYGDNKGRLFRSFVGVKYPPGHAAVSGDNASLANKILLHDIRDKNITPANGIVGMEPILVNDSNLVVEGKTQLTKFTKITSITCTEDYIVVGGYSADGNHNIFVADITHNTDERIVGYEKDTNGADDTSKPIMGEVVVSNTFNWKNYTISGQSNYTIEDTMIHDNYVYCVGTNGTKGYIRAIDLSCFGGTTTTISDGTNSASGGYYKYDVDMPIYSIAGR